MARSPQDLASIKLTKADYQAQAEFRYALRRFLRFSEDATRASGMTPQKYQAMLAVKAFPGAQPITIGQLAERLQVHHHSAGGIVTRLERQGLVRREPDDQDRRQVYVRLTPAGERILRTLVQAHRDELTELWPQLQQPAGRMPRK